LQSWDVIVVGGGNAALCAALSASESASRVLILERAHEDEAGGNSRFTAGLFRIAYEGVDDLRTLIPICRKTRSPTRISVRTPRSSSSTTWHA
jgi:tricarballylate dehydrogenase